MIHLLRNSIFSCSAKVSLCAFVRRMKFGWRSILLSCRSLTGALASWIAHLFTNIRRLNWSCSPLGSYAISIREGASPLLASTRTSAARQHGYLLAVEGPRGIFGQTLAIRRREITFSLAVREWLEQCSCPMTPCHVRWKCLDLFSTSGIRKIQGP